LIYRFSLISFIFLNTQVFANTISIKVIDPKHSAVQGVITYLTPKNKNFTFPISRQPLTISQNNKKFTPYIAVLQKGQKINFKNQDDVTHHIYSVSGENRFDFKIKAGTQNNNTVVKTAGEVAMGCNIHDWMSGYVLVVNTPYFIQTDSEGSSIFEDIPSGNYKLTIWHPQLATNKNEFIQELEIQSNKTIEIILPKALLPIPVQQNQDEFDFLEGY